MNDLGMTLAWLAVQVALVAGAGRGAARAGLAAGCGRGSLGRGVWPGAGVAFDRRGVRARGPRSAAMSSRPVAA